MSDRLVGDHIENLKAYEPGKPIDELERELGIEGAIKLASNENPLGPAPAAVEAVREAASGVHIYPDGGTYRLREALSDFLDVRMEQIIVGNGSNEVINLIVRTFCGPGDHAIISDHSFIAYKLILQGANVATTSVSMQEGYVHDLPGMADAVTSSTRVVFVANPNNPTGTYVGERELAAFLDALPESVIAVVDEAYVEYALADDYTSALELRDVHDNLVVLRTFSKCYGLAGLRCGYGIAPARLVDYMNRVRDPFNSNILAQIAGIAALGDDDFVERSVASNEEGRARMESGLAQMKELGVDWVPSQTNFLLVQTPRPGSEIYDAMLRQGVIVRPMAGYGLPNHLRVTIGTPDEVDRCLDALRTVMTD